MTQARERGGTIVWTNVHGDEAKSGEVGRSLRERPIAGVTARTANVRAYWQRERFVDKNMALAFSRRERGSAAPYDDQRAVEVLAVSSVYRNIVDLHNVREHGGDFAQINPNRVIAPSILNFLGHVGIEHVLVADIGLYAEVDNGVLIEMGKDFDQGRLRDGLDLLTNNPEALKSRAAESFTWLDYAGGLHATHVAQEGEDWLATLQKFGEVTHVSADQKTLVMSWASQPNAQGYHGELATPRATPPVLRHF